MVDAQTGRVDLNTTLSIEEDYFIPVNGQTSTKIESVAGGKYTGDIEDVKYLRDKLFPLKFHPLIFQQIMRKEEEKINHSGQKDIRLQEQYSDFNALLSQSENRNYPSLCFGIQR